MFQGGEVVELYRQWLCHMTGWGASSTVFCELPLPPQDPQNIHIHLSLPCKHNL